MTNELQRTESSSRTQHFLSQSVNSLQFMVPEFPLPFSQDYSNYRCPAPARSRAHLIRHIHIHSHSLRRFEGCVQVQGSFYHFVNTPRLYGEELLDCRPTPKLENRPLSAVRYCLCSTLTATIHICR
jgi:hypothetical protein